MALEKISKIPKSSSKVNLCAADNSRVSSVPSGFVSGGTLHCQSGLHNCLGHFTWRGLFLGHYLTLPGLQIHGRYSRTFDI